jgi:hypothetical protein
MFPALRGSFWRNGLREHPVAPVAETGAGQPVHGRRAPRGVEGGQPGALPGRWRRFSRIGRRWIVVIAALLIALRLCLPFGVKWFVNRKLNEAHDYGGRISHVDIQLWRGQYRIHAIEIFKRAGDVPFFSAPRMDLAIEWRELFHGAVVGQVIMHEPRLNFISGPPEAETLSGRDESWDRILEGLFPFKLNRLEIHGGQIHFENPYMKPPVDIFLNSLSATATNLTNTRELKVPLPAGIVAGATTIGGGGLDLRLQLDPVAAAPTYQVSCALTNVDLTAMNSFLQAYGKFDVERGGFAMFTSVASKDGSYDGYVKVFFKDLKVFDWQKEKKKSVPGIIWQAVVGAFTTTLKNQRSDSLASKAPVSGTYQRGSVGMWAAIVALLRNAFVQALVPKFDEPVTIGSVEAKARQKEEVKKAGADALQHKGAEVLTKPPT